MVSDSAGATLADVLIPADERIYFLSLDVTTSTSLESLTIFFPRLIYKKIITCSAYSTACGFILKRFDCAYAKDILVIGYLPPTPETVEAIQTVSATLQLSVLS